MRFPAPLNLTAQWRRSFLEISVPQAFAPKRERKARDNKRACSDRLVRTRLPIFPKFAGDRMLRAPAALCSLPEIRAAGPP
jgi:hypothetical protein